MVASTASACTPPHLPLTLRLLFLLVPAAVPDLSLPNALVQHGVLLHTPSQRLQIRSGEENAEHVVMYAYGRRRRATISSRILPMPGPRPSYDLGPARAVVGRTPVLAVDRIKLLYQLAKTCVNASTREAGALRVCLQGCLAYAGCVGVCTVRIHIVHRVHRYGRARSIQGCATATEAVTDLFRPTATRRIHSHVRYKDLIANRPVYSVHPSK